MGTQREGGPCCGTKRESPRGPGLRRSRLQAPQRGTAHAAAGRRIHRADPGRVRLAGDRGSRFPPALARTVDSDLTTDVGTRAVRRRYYDLFSRFYDRFVAWHSGEPTGPMRRALAERATRAPVRRVLDLCCGTGAVTRALAESGAGGSRRRGTRLLVGNALPRCGLGAAGGPLRHPLGAGRRLALALQGRECSTP